jgi:UDP-N-acetylmuramoylalanine--D-glutamate ligase
MNFKNKKALILGFGISGQSAAKFLAANGSEIIIYDKRNEEQFDTDVLLDLKNRPNVVFSFGEETIKPDDSLDMLVVSPGIRPDNPIVQEAKTKGIEIHNDITLFLEAWDGRGPVVGVTGSNGKSTIVSLIYDVLTKLDHRAELGGNIGKSPLDFVSSAKNNTVAVLEISNYQAEYFTEKHFVDIAVITNISDNHLDRHNNDRQEYANAKLNIIKKKHTKVILNTDDRGIIKHVISLVENNYLLPVSLETNVEEVLNDGVYSGDNAEIMIKNGDHLSIALDKTDDRKLLGLHNLYNIACVYGVLELLKIDYKKAEKAIRDFRGLDHRIQFIKNIAGVVFVNDSKSTSPDATQKALEAVGEDKKVILISGGDSKGVSYKTLKDHFIKYLKHMIVLPGSAQDQLVDMASGNDIEFHKAKDMSEAVRIADNFSEEGDIVLLSPGTSSLNQFKGFDDRGEEFVRYVEGLN